MAKAKKTRKGANMVKRVGNKDHKVDLSAYKRVKSASGAASLICGDDVSKSLVGKDLDAVYSTASKVLRESVVALRRQYKHLNVGMQRMNLGNRIRGAQA